jgi:UDPglucose--hexose-1-phosphate uridylyltransferase
MVRFEEKMLTTRFSGSDGKPMHHTIVHRIDPVTGSSVRLTGRRPMDPAALEGTVPDISEQVEKTRGCPFCPGNLEKMTPLFCEHGPEAGRFRRGQSVLFPNLAPYGRNSGVCIFSKDHHIEMGQFGAALYVDAIKNCLDYMMSVQSADPDSTYQVLSQNILPSSGGSLLHPHLQVNVDVEPMNYHRFVAARSGSGSGCLPGALRDAEVQEGRRLIAQSNCWTLWAAFAPLGEWEVQAAAPEVTGIAQLKGEALDELVSLVLKVHSYWRAKGRNAGNMALFATTTSDHGLFLRMLPRSSYRNWYRSDRSCYEVGMLEPASDLMPETLALQMREFFREQQ